MIILKTLLGILLMIVFILLLWGWCTIWEWLKNKYYHSKMYKKWNKSRLKNLCGNAIVIGIIGFMIFSLLFISYFIGEIIL